MSVGGKLTDVGNEEGVGERGVDRKSKVKLKDKERKMNRKATNLKQ